VLNVGRHELDWDKVPREGPTGLDLARELHGAVLHPARVFTTRVFVPLECGLRIANTAPTAALDAIAAPDTILAGDAVGDRWPDQLPVGHPLGLQLRQHVIQRDH
jgi:hypothetical protein